MRRDAHGLLFVLLVMLSRLRVAPAAAAATAAAPPVAVLTAPCSKRRLSRSFVTTLQAAPQELVGGALVCLGKLPVRSL